MSLRGSPLEQSATLPDGRTVAVRVGVPNDPYLAKRELETVAVELESGGEHLAAVNTVLSPEDESEARALLHAIVEGLESGQLEPTAGAIEPLADSIPAA
jgi:hypothetical protein